MDGGRINAGVYTLYRDNYKKQDKRVVNITVKPTVTDCTGSVWFTDLMLQEGDKVTGFVINSETFLENTMAMMLQTERGFITVSSAPLLPASSSTSAPLLLVLTTRSIRFRRWLPGVYRLRWVKVLIRQLSKQRLLPVMNLTFCFYEGMPEERLCNIQGRLFQYSAAGDSKHPITVADKKSARIYVEFQEMQDGGDAL